MAYETPEHLKSPLAYKKWLNNEFRKSWIRTHLMRRFGKPQPVENFIELSSDLRPYFELRTRTLHASKLIKDFQQYLETGEVQ